MADKVLIDGLIKFCDEKSKNIKLKAEPQVFIEIKQALEELKNLKPSKKGFITIGQTIEDFEKEIRAKAIDEFAEKLRDGSLDILTWLMSRQKVGYGTTNGELHGKWLNKIDDVAEQLKKAGVKNDN